MTPNDYQSFVASCPLYDDVLYGLIGEIGELTEIIKKDVRQGRHRKPMSRDDFVKEAGDCFWYLTRLLSSKNITLEEVLEENVRKLKERHGM